MSDPKEIFDSNIIDRYVERLDWQVNENSNMTFSLQGLHNYISTEVSEEYWLKQIYPEDIKKAHEQGDFHIHQLNSLSVYCVGWDLEQLLKKGFCGVRGKVESRPPKHFRSALGQVADFLYTLQGESAGAQSFSNIDTLLAPFIYYDELSDEHLEQALQEFLFNMNIPTRVGFQTPFTNISLDLTIPPYLKDKPAIIGGKTKDKKYGEFQREVDRFNKAFAKTMMKGDARGRIFTFPIPTYNITKDFDWDNPAIDHLWELSAKYGIPYFSNFINSDQTPEDVRTMHCRLRLDKRVLAKRGGGFFGANPMTGSIGAVTINLPRIGFASSNEEEFFHRLYDCMVLAKESLEIKRHVSEEFTDHKLYPYTKHYLKPTKDKYNGYWFNHFSTIGILGMNEAIINLLATTITTPKGQKFANQVLDFMNEALKIFQEETGHPFNLEATPAESTAYRLACKDKALFPDIIVANEKEYRKNNAAPFYTNSSQLPVNFTDDIFEALELQDELQSKYTGGTVLHFFAGERIADPKTVKQLVKKICTNYRLPYFTFTPTFSICPEHGYLSGKQVLCPKCSSKSEVYSRIVGYVRPIEQWNEGKKAEFSMRKNFRAHLSE